MLSSLRSRRLLAVAIVAALVAIGLACSVRRGPGDEPAAGAGAGEGESAAAAEVEPPPPPEPDALPDPQVPPGRCESRTYTPPTAEDPHDGLLCRPTEGLRDVAEILVHGGGVIEGGYTSLNGWAKRLNVEGYVTFQISYHLFSPNGAGPVFPLPEQNVKAAVQYLRGTGDALGIRKDRIVVQGHSAGARIGAVAYTSPERRYFEGDELWPDISDRVDAFIGFYHPYDGTMQYSTTYFGGGESSTDPDVEERWDEADSLADAAEADAPALFVTGSEDWDVIDEQQDAFVAALRRDRQAARAVVIDGGAHGFDLGGSRLTRLGEEAATHVLEFLNDAFPQDPPRPAQSGEVDLSKAPSGTGTPPTTVAVRTRRSTGSSGSGSSGGSGSGSSGGSGSGRSTTTAGGSATTVDPSTTTPPSTSATTAAPSTTSSAPASTATTVTTPPTSVTTPPTSVTTPPSSVTTPPSTPTASP